MPLVTEIPPNVTKIVAELVRSSAIATSSMVEEVPKVQLVVGISFVGTSKEPDKAVETQVAYTSLLGFTQVLAKVRVAWDDLKEKSAV